MKNLFQEKSYRFALEIIQICKLLDERKAFAISKQLFRSGTSIGANIEEAQQAQSRADFISKYSIALKEAVETDFWLRLIRDAKILSLDNACFDHVRELQRLLTSAIKKTKLQV